MKTLDSRTANLIAGLIAGVAIGYCGCWLDESNRHKYTNRTVSKNEAHSAAGGLSSKGLRAEAAKTPPGERTPPAAENSNDAVGGRQRAAAWLEWLTKPERLFNLAAAIAFATWAGVELLEWRRERDRRRRGVHVVTYEFTLRPGGPTINDRAFAAAGDVTFEGVRIDPRSLAWNCGTLGVVSHGHDDLFEQAEAFTLEPSFAHCETVRVELLDPFFDGKAKPGDAINVLRSSFAPYVDASGLPMHKGRKGIQ